MDVLVLLGSDDEVLPSALDGRGENVGIHLSQNDRRRLKNPLKQLPSRQTGPR